MTSVMSAAFSGNAEIVQYLMDQGASVTAVNEFNGTAYSIAKIKNHYEVLALLAPYEKPIDESNPYKLALTIMYKAIVRRVRYFTYKVRHYTGLDVLEFSEEL